MALITNIAGGEDGCGTSAGHRAARLGPGPCCHHVQPLASEGANHHPRKSFHLGRNITVITSGRRKGNSRRGDGCLPTTSGPVEALDCLQEPESDSVQTSHPEHLLLPKEAACVRAGVCTRTC